MLLGLDPHLSPDLLHALAAMGHGDRIVLVDANYPATRGRRCIGMPGIDVVTALKAVLSVLPCDTFVPDPAAIMQAQRDLLVQDVVGLMERHFDGAELSGVVHEIDKLFSQRFDNLVSSLELGKPPRGGGGSGPQGGHGGGRRPRHLH